MMTQLVPSESSSAQAPSVAGRMAVLGVALSMGTMLDASLSTVCAWMFLKFSVRPGNELGAGMVTTCAVPRLKMKYIPRPMVAGDPVNVAGAIAELASLISMLVSVPSAV